MAELPLIASFIKAATWHGGLDEASAMLADHPELATASIHTAAILGDEATVRKFLSHDPASATATAPPFDANALTCLGLSRYLRLDPSRSAAFLQAATALLDAGADPNGGFMTRGSPPEFETPLYGASGVAHHAGMTRLLIDRGADPNDDEVAYHTPESYDNGALKVLVETGRMTRANLTMMLVRKHDWHDYDGARYLLEHGTDPNDDAGRGWLPMHHAIARDNRLEMIQLLLDHGADPLRIKDGLTAVERAARRGRDDILAEFERRGIPVERQGLAGLIAACARNDGAAIAAIAAQEPGSVQQLVANGVKLLVEFAGVGNSAGVGRLLDLGIPVGTPFAEGDGYWGLAAGSTALHNAAWRARPDTLKLLISRGAPVNLRDLAGRTPLMLAIKACVDSFWSDRRSPESVAALLGAGASIDGVTFPTGYAEVDALLAARRIAPSSEPHPHND